MTFWQKDPSQGLQYFLFLALLAVIFIYEISGSEGTFSLDAWYHFKVAELIWSGNWLQPIIWLPDTILGKEGVDHHWFFHYLISPFAALSDRVTGLKAATVFMALIASATVLWAAVVLRLRWPLFWALAAVMLSLTMPTRLLMLRSQTLALMFILLVMLAMLRNRNWLVAVLAFCFMQSYHGAVILLPIAGLYCLVKLFAEKKVDPWPMLACISGLLLALVINPWFPGNVDYLMFHLFFKTGLQAQGFSGSEWRPLTWNTFRVILPAVILLLAALFVYLVKGAKDKDEQGRLDMPFFIAVTVMFFMLFSGAVRFEEYFTPLACLTSGLLISRSAFSVPLQVISGRGVVIFLSCLIVAGQFYMSSYLHRSSNTYHPFSLAPITSYLNEQAEAGSYIVLTNWSMFPLLLWDGERFVYAEGLDGAYLAYTSVGKYNLLQKLKYGRVQNEEVVKVIRENFESQWVIVNIDPRHKKFFDQLVASPSASLVARSGVAYLFYLE
jgi:hypothetical protein